MRNMCGVGLVGNMPWELGTRTVCKAYLLFSGTVLRTEINYVQKAEVKLNNHKYQFCRIILLLTRDHITKKNKIKLVWPCSQLLQNWSLYSSELSALICFYSTLFCVLQKWQCFKVGWNYSEMSVVYAILTLCDIQNTLQ